MMDNLVAWIKIEESVMGSGLFYFGRFLIVFIELEMLLVKRCHK